MIAGIGVPLLAVALAAGCGGAERLERQGSAQPVDIAAGQVAYETTCAACHGTGGRGSPKGPPLVDRIYEPSHHADASFVIAVRQGVPEHHWTFGDMPPQPNVSDSDVTNIVGYIRGIQRKAGIS
jgi:mono/diheme cytochrome c family protein